MACKRLSIAAPLVFVFKVLWYRSMTAPDLALRASAAKRALQAIIIRIARAVPRGIAVPAVALIALVASVARAASYSGPTDAELERRIQSEIAARDPEGAALFARSTQLRDLGNDDATAELLEKVHARDPWFVHATRRLCAVEARRGHGERALALCREAFESDPSALNGSALAFTLLMIDKRTSDNGLKALDLAKEAARKAPDDFYVEMTLCQAALTMHDSHALSQCTAVLRRIAPHDAAALYVVALQDASQGKLHEATRELDEARAGGLPEASYAPLHNAIERSRSPLDRWGPILLEVMVAWLATFALLLSAGALLSALTLKFVTRAPAEATAHPKGVDAWLRRTYRVVLAATCVYYYLSLPFVALSVLALGAGVLYLCMSAGQIPIKLILIGGVMVFVTLAAMARSLFVRGKDRDPGQRLVLSGHPRLLSILNEAAERIGTRPVDSVYLTPGTEISVLERGGMLGQWRGTSERCLVLGAAVLDGMRVRELKAILAHEYGHFRNEDTAGGGFALAVRRSLFTFAMHMARGGAASTINPAWWFVRAFERVFHRVSQGAARLQETLADRWAAYAYGSEAFAHGLTHVVAQTVRFNAHVQATLGEVVPAKVPLANLYGFVPSSPVDAKKVGEQAEREMSRPASPYDSHPPPADRIAYVRKFELAGPPETDDDVRDAWTLLSEREAIEKRMTDEVRAQLAAQGVRVEAAP
jgi:Zn-dependent protease with chaperone function